MKGKDEIKELFQKELGNYEAKVDPSLWNGIQSGMAGASSSAAGSSMSVAAKAVISVVVASAVTIGSIAIFSEKENETSKQEKIVKTESTKENKQKPKTTDKIKEINKEENKTIAVSEEETEITTEPKEKEEELKVNHSNDSLSDDSTISEKSSTKEVGKEAPKDSEHLEKENTKNNQPKEEQPTIELKGEITIEEQKNQYVKFTAITENAEAIEWDFGDGNKSTDLNPEYFYEDAGIYDVVATIYGKTKTIQKNIQVNVKLEGKLTNLPNIFSPNNDGSNDVFSIEYKGIEEFQITIFNRKQEVLYKSDNVDFMWNGTDMKGQPVPTGKYVYVIMARDGAGNVINKYESLEVQR